MIVGVPSELGVAEVRHAAATVRVADGWIPGVEGVDVEVFHTVGAVHVVQRGALAQRGRQDPVAVHAEVRVAGEQPFAVVFRNLGEAAQVLVRHRSHGAFDHHVRQRRRAAGLRVVNPRLAGRPNNTDASSSDGYIHAVPAGEWVTAAIGVGGTVTVAISTMVFTAFRDGRQRRTDSRIRADHWERDAAIRIEEMEESRATRQEQRLADAIVSFGEAVKNQSRVCALLAAHVGLKHYSTEKIDPAEAEALLALYERERTVEFERLLLFADADLQKRARAWSTAVKEATAIRGGLSVVSPETFAHMMNAASTCRDQFYECARKAIGVTSELDPTPQHDLDTPGVLPQRQPD